MTNVHFVGSVALDTPEEVFAAIGQRCGRYLKRVPDGEPHGRRLWISWQVPVLRANPALEQVGPGQVPLKLAPGVDPEQIHWGELGYAREARPGYEDFLSARRAGKIPEGVRFQVSLPTPWGVIMPFCQQPDAQQIYPSYERAMVREVERISSQIPHADLAIQWDVCIEMVQWDGRRESSPPFPGMEQVYSGIFSRLAAAVPDDVELGFHLCYGDYDGKHFIDPVDGTKMVELANLIARSAARPITWMHMPVPIDRSDDAFFAPLAGLALGVDTELYLGLVHAEDGVEGTLRRAAAARRYVSDFGIGSECGISRARDSDLAMRFIETYAGAAAALEVPQTA
jgi:methionine synthase II (cobalamin-independent)